MKYLFFLVLVFFLGLSSCKKCNLKGDIILSEEFDNYGDWLLYSEYSPTDEFYSRIENGVLKLKTDNQYDACPRATWNIPNDLNGIKGFQVCIKIKELSLSESTSLDFYFSVGAFEMHGNIEKSQSTNTRLIYKVDEKGISSNLRGAVNGQIGQKIEKDNHLTNFIQISLCPNEDVTTAGEMYVEIEGIEMTIL